MISDSRDITQIYHQHDIFSHMAHLSIRGDKARLRNMVVNFIRDKGSYGATCDEIEQALELSHQTASARITEAKARDQIVWNGEKRKTRSGRAAAVLVIK